MGSDSYRPPSVSDASTDEYLESASRVAELSPPRSMASREGSRQRAPSSVRHDGYTADSEPFRQSRRPANEAPMRPPEPQNQSIYNGVSPDLIAEITAKITKEVVEKLQLSQSIDISHDEPKDQPTRQRSRTPSPSSSSSSPPPNPSPPRIHTPPSPAQAPKRPSYAPPPSPPADSSGFPQAGPGEVRANMRSAYRPAGPNHTYSTAQLSTIDQKWGRLFEQDHTPTARLGQFFRGLANHLIEDFEPKNSLVVTPEKLATYYATYALGPEVYPLVAIFRTTVYEELSDLYQHLGCQHHLVQDRVDSTPSVPGLTPAGFASWMTILLLAHPDGEARRLEKVVLDLPINADGQFVDGKPERLPKQISRHLLPSVEDRKSRKLLRECINNFLDETEKETKRRPRKNSSNSPPLSREPSSTQTAPRTRQSSPTAEPYVTKPIERERMPYSGIPSLSSESSAVEDTLKIERERQPYSAQPGSGRASIDILNNKPPTAPPATSGPPQNRPTRADSLSRASGNDELSPDRYRHHRAQSSAAYMPPPRSLGVGGGGGRGGPPPPNTRQNFSQANPPTIHNHGTYNTPFSHANSQPFGSGPSPQPSAFPPPPTALDPRDAVRDRDERRYREAEMRRTAEEEARLAGLFSSPRDAERWDRIQEGGGGSGLDPRGGAGGLDPRASAGGYEDYYRAGGRGGGSFDGGQYHPRYN